MPPSLPRPPEPVLCLLSPIRQCRAGNTLRSPPAAGPLLCLPRGPWLRIAAACLALRARSMSRGHLQKKGAATTQGCLHAEQNSLLPSKVGMEIN